MTENGKALALISKAERSLAEATEIAEILNLRDVASGVAVIAAAKGMEEAAQRAKVFQLRCERKAGQWLDQNGPTPGRYTSANSPTLGELEIDDHDSSRWKTIARLPQADFDAWLDNNLAKGKEVTRAALLRFIYGSEDGQKFDFALSPLERAGEAVKALMAAVDDLAAGDSPTKLKDLVRIATLLKGVLKHIDGLLSERIE